MCFASILALKNFRPGSEKNFFLYDIALITLSEAFNRSYKQTLVRPICLPKVLGLPNLDKDITIIGMGDIGKKGTKKDLSPRKLQYARMKRITPRECLRKWDR